MNFSLDHLRADFLNPAHVAGATVWAIAFLGLAVFLAAAVRRLEVRLESRLSDVTGLRFASAFVQVPSYLASFLPNAHLVRELRALGTAVLASVSVVSVVLGLATQNTLGNLVSGVSFVLYRPFRVGDNVEINSPRGVMMAAVAQVSLGYTMLPLP